MESRPPNLVCRLCTWHNAVVVGSAADPLCIEPKDWDVLVPFSQWKYASLLIPKTAIPNTFGGWKYKNIDVWPGELTDMLDKTNFIWNPIKGFRYRIERNSK